MNAKILIGGATGTNGSSVVNALSQKDLAVRALVREPEKATAIAGPGVELVAGDYMDIASLETALRGIDVAYFIGAVHPDYTVWFENFLDAARRSGVQRMVKFSGMTSSLDADSEIIRMHGKTDQLLVESGMAYTILRPNSFYQNMLMSADSIKKQGQFYLNMADAGQSMVDVRDITAVGVKVLTEPGHEEKIYEITGPEALTYHDVAEKLSKALGKKITYVPVSDQDAENGLKSAGLPDWWAHVLAEILRYFAAGNAQKITPTVKDITGNDPITFDQFAKDFADGFR